jgi:hypothetical protein
MMNLLKQTLDLLGIERISEIIVLAAALASTLFGVVKYFDLQHQLRRWILGKRLKGKSIITTSSFADPVLHSTAKNIERQQQFKELTGIYLHPDRIDALTVLWNKSNGAFDWPHIKTAMSYIKLTEQGYRVSISKWDRLQDFFLHIVFAVPALLFLTLFSLMIASVMLEKDANLLPKVFAIILCLVGFFGTVAFMQYQRRAYLCARRIMRNLG